MCHKIVIGGMELPVITSVKIKKDVTKITDTATIICPAVAHGRPLSFVSKLAKWQQVSIQLGYDNKLNEEFSGYVKSVSINDNQVTIECEDSLYLFQRVQIPNGEKTDISLKELLSHIVGLVNDFIQKEGLGQTLNVNCKYDYKYSKFTFVNATAYNVIDKIQKEGNPNIYILNNVLNILPQYTNTIGSARYDLAKNICKDGLKLKWREKSDKNLYVEVSSKGLDGKDIKATAGIQGEDKMEIKFTTMNDKKSLQTIADNLYKSKVYTGYEGSFCSWLIPFCDANYEIELADSSKVLNSGKYYVTSVVVEFSSSGGKRTISLGAAVSD